MVLVGPCSLCMKYMNDGHIAVVYTAYSSGCDSCAWNDLSLSEPRMCEPRMDRHQSMKSMLMMLQASQDASLRILETGYHDSSDKIFHMACDDVLEQAHPNIKYASKFAAQLVFYKLGEAARQQQLAWFESAAEHTHRQVARGYWFECMAHKVLSNGGEFPFRLLGKLMSILRLSACCLPCLHHCSLSQPAWHWFSNSACFTCCYV